MARQAAGNGPAHTAHGANRQHVQLVWAGGGWCGMLVVACCALLSVFDTSTVGDGLHLAHCFSIIGRQTHTTCTNRHSRLSAG